jgi:hypothetical protein
MGTDTGYVSGACNIGPAEIRRRRFVGWLGVAATLFLCVGLRLVDAEPVWRLAVFIPASLAASGFIQARMRFCAAFGYVGVYNFEGLGSQQRVKVEEALAKDRRKAWSVAWMSAGIGAVAAIAAVGISATF